MAVTSQDIANQAIMLMGDDTPPVSGFAPTFDNSTAGKALQKLYTPCVQTVAKQFGWDFARNLVALTLSGNTPLFGFSFEYLYPTNGVEVWQVAPATQTDPNNPEPVNWTVYNTLVSSVQTKVIGCNAANAIGIYNNAPGEATWDALFREAVARLLASELSDALAGKPDTSERYLNSGAAFESLGQGRAG